MPRKAPIKIKNKNKFPLLNDEHYKILNPRQKHFIYEVFMKPITKKTKCQIYREVMGRTEEGDMSQSAASHGYNNMLLSKKVQNALFKLQEHIQKQLEISPNRILKEEACIAFSNPVEYLDNEGFLTKKPHELPEQLQRAIKSLDVIHQKSGGIIYKISMWDKGRALARLENILGMEQAKRLEISGPNGGPIQVECKYNVEMLGYDEKRTLQDLLKKCRVTDVPLRKQIAL